MNSNQAKQIQIVEYLYKIGIKTAKTKGTERWYNSPFREDKDASFKVDTILNVWYDFGSGQGGNILDVVMQINNCNLSQALSLLSDSTLKLTLNTKYDNSRKFIKTIADEKEKKIVVVDILHPALLDYSQTRGISTDLLRKYTKQIHYDQNGKKLFAIGFKTRSKGWELRNKYTKGNIGGKDITVIIENEKPNINVFEGFFDFLAHRQIYKNNSNSIVMNSTSLLNDTLLELKNHKRISLFLDNDQNGKTTAQTIQNNCSNVSNFSHIYENFNDLNCFLQNNV